MIAQPLPRTPDSVEDETVVVVHGLAGKRLWMHPLCCRLRSQGYRVRNWRYSSLHGSITEHAQRFYDYLTASLYGEPRIHIVAHSMGAIVVRAALAAGPVVNLGRVVLLAPPNHGAPIAREVARVAGSLCRTIGELSDRPDSFVNGLPHLRSVDVGILAAKFDVMVPIESTHLDGECEHAVLNATHTSILLSRTVANFVLSFLAAGRFEACR